MAKYKKSLCIALTVLKKMGVYRMQSEECEMMCIGVTGRTVEYHMKDHSKRKN